MATPRKSQAQKIATMNAYLQRTQAEIDASLNHKSLRPYQTPINDRPRDEQSRTRGYREPFRHHSPLVQEAAKKWLNILIARHKHKIDEKVKQGKGSSARGHYGCLVATATHMAKRELGLLPSTAEIAKNGRYRRKARSAIKVKLGIRDRNVERVPAPPMPNLEVHQGNLEGI